jgi:hypothetical protein
MLCVGPLPVVTEVEPAAVNLSSWFVLSLCQGELVSVLWQYIVKPAVAQCPVLPSS